MSRSPAVVVRSDDCLLHVPGAEIWVGVTTPGTELPERATRIEQALRRDGHRVVGATAHDDDVLLRVHDPLLVKHLRTVYARWVEAGFPDDPGQDRVVPYLIPSAGMLDGLPEREPTAVHAAAPEACEQLTVTETFPLMTTRPSASRSATVLERPKTGRPSSSPMTTSGGVTRRRASRAVRTGPRARLAPAPTGRQGPDHR